MHSRVAPIRSTTLAPAVTAAHAHTTPGDAATTLSFDEIVTPISNKRDQMPAFGRAYKPEDLQDVAAYIVGQLRAK